jgi:hypothetical protein
MSIVTYNNRSIANISAVPGAAKSLIHIKTLTASSSSTLSFVNGSNDVVLDSTYPIYLFKFINCHPSVNGVLAMQFNLSADTGSNYNVTKTSTVFAAYHDEGDSATGVTYDTNYDLAQSTGFQNISQSVGGENDESTSGKLYLFNPSSTTFVKHFMSETSTYNSANFENHRFTAGYGNTTSAVDAIQFKMAEGNIDAGTIKLYGIKDS